MTSTKSGSRRLTSQDLLRHASALSELGNLAMSGTQLPLLMQTAVALVVETLNLDSCEVMELLPGQEAFVLSASAGLPESCVGEILVPNDIDSQAGFTLRRGTAVCSRDLRTEGRFRPLGLLLEQGLVSGVTVPIRWNSGVFGVLGAHSKSHRIMHLEELHFLRAVARSLASNAEHHRKETCIRSSQARLHAILDTAADGIVTIGQEGTIESFNLAAERLFGYQSSEVRGRNIGMLMPAPFRDEHSEYVKNYLDTGTKRLIGAGRQVVGLRKDGTTFPADLDVSEVRLGARRIFTGIIRDASARIETELQLRRLSELKSEFVALVSHELRAPLTNLSGGLELIKQELSSLPPEGEHTLELLVKEVARLARLVESILDISKLDAGELPLNLGLLWLEPVIDRVVASPSWACRARKIDMRLDTRLPPVWADEVYVEQALRNVLENSLRYSPGDESVVVSARAEAGKVEVSITDSGPGISPEERARIFDAFYRGVDFQAGTPGYGLGLYFARKFIEAQGGSLTVISPAYEGDHRLGTTFTMSLPLADEEEGS